MKKGFIRTSSDLFEHLQCLVRFHNRYDFRYAEIGPAKYGCGQMRIVFSFEQPEHPVAGNIEPLALDLDSYRFIRSIPRSITRCLSSGE